MFVYSEKIIRFINQIKFTLKKILVEEVRLKVNGDRFYDKSGRSFPIKIVIFNKKNKLGYFDSDFLELGFHQSVIYHSYEGLTNLIRHELAHYLTFIKHGGGILPHGNEFKSICKELNWGKQVYEAVTTFEPIPLLEKSSIARKIEKLIALGASPNPHESSLAMLKSRELLLKHNITESFESEAEVILKRLLKQKRLNAKIQSIAHILETFFVNIVFSYSNEGVCLEITGNAVNIEIAEYIASILDIELDRLWESSGLTGLSAKNSFFDGIARGYCKKIEDLNNSSTKETSTALMKIENTLTIAKSLIYPRLSQTRSSRKSCPFASNLGQKAGKNLEFKKGIANVSNSPKLLGN